MMVYSVHQSVCPHCSAYLRFQGNKQFGAPQAICGKCGYRFETGLTEWAKLPAGARSSAWIRELLLPSFLQYRGVELLVLGGCLMQPFLWVMGFAVVMLPVALVSGVLPVGIAAIAVIAAMIAGAAVYPWLLVRRMRRLIGESNAYTDSGKLPIIKPFGIGKTFANEGQAAASRPHWVDPAAAAAPGSAVGVGLSAPVSPADAGPWPADESRGRGRTLRWVGGGFLVLVLVVTGAMLVAGRGATAEPTDRLTPTARPTVAQSVEPSLPATAEPSLPATVVPTTQNSARTGWSIAGVPLASGAPKGSRFGYVEQGWQIIVHATGEWCLGGSGATAECGKADGIRLARADETDVLLPSAPIGMIIGRIGDGPWFAVGSSFSAPAKASGYLTLAFNDRACCYVDNLYSVVVDVAAIP
jgi:hypothetical protein